MLDDVEPDEIADKLFWGAFANNGQICMAIKRVYVPEARYDAVVEALAQRARSVRVGNGAEESTQLGPLNNAPQYQRVTELVDDALHAGGIAVTGGKPMEGPGYFFEPTIVAGLSDGTRLVDEEQFGPALPVISYRDLDDAVAARTARTSGCAARSGQVTPSAAGGRGAAGVRHRLGQRAHGAHPRCPLRRGQVERPRGRGRAVGRLRHDRAAGAAPHQEALVARPPAGRELRRAVTRAAALVLDVEHPLGVAVVELLELLVRDGRRVHERHGGRRRLIRVVDGP